MTRTGIEHSFDFSQTLRAITEKRRLIPLVNAYFNQPRFGFDIPVEPWTDRHHDGYWHPSSHGTWDARALFLYLAYPEKVLGEKMGPPSVKAVTSGKFWHMFYQFILLDMGVLIPHDNPQGMSPAEVPLRSEEYRIRGHADGHLVDDANYSDELLEVKTINEFQSEKVVNQESLEELKPEYYGQTQTYLFLKFGPGRGTMRYLVVHPGFPFKEIEFTVEADARYQRRRMRTYRDTWALVQAHQRGEDVELPDICTGCGGGKGLTKVCALRRPCPIGRTHA